MMLCESCGQREATTVLKKTINGKTQMVHLCSHCANSMLLNNFFSDFTMGNLFADDFSVMPKQKVCEKCGSSLEEIMETGKVGCDQCYHTFGSELMRSVEKIHGKSAHVGKVPKSAKGALRKKNLLTEYRMELNRLIAEQEFEQAAQVRDRIRELEQGGEEQ
ncbi:MAG: UvrB/UvrC motif-containing protein [Massiliimalia sp.]